ncbi:PREDICTED: kallikrein-1-like [Chrysochloris asiatica]|uniref:Kallikrein-1-like n=1 Tax=Chrysochloris asiatica TaxID=185453 RepID=A0A9B0TTJ5_CHRAS|nr:PREDICTED: kallikrein-1-like [Chrysochloris asiatica]
MWFLILCLSLTLRWTGAAAPVADRRSECKKRSHPWQVAIYDYDTFICGGVLIHPQWVLTASTCHSRHYELWMGIHNLHRQEITAQLANVTDYFRHPIYDLSVIKKGRHTSRVLYAEPSQDFMLLRLEKPVQITDFVDVVKLPTSELRQWNNCVAMGWGKCSEERIGMKPGIVHA